jgi:hypothetical protein
MNIAFDGIREVVVTFLATEDTQAGDLVKISDQGTVAPCQAGDKFCGQVLSVEDGAAAVQMGGFLTVNCASGCPALGYVTLAADGAGGVKTADTGREVLVVATDTNALTAVIDL